VTRPSSPRPPSLSPEGWVRFTLGQQVLQIGAEMQRGLDHLDSADMERLRPCYERALGLVDLTVQVNPLPSLRRELLRWREVVAGLYLRDRPDRELHRLAFRALLELHPQSQGQVVLLEL
jgi:hypothetical protein